jgi:hypothetical protein
MESNELLNSGGISAILISVILAGRYFIRRIAKDGLEVAKDRAEVDILDIYKKEVLDLRDRLEKSDRERQEALVKTYSMAAEISGLKTQIDMLKRELTVMHREVEKLSKIIQEEIDGRGRPINNT